MEKKKTTLTVKEALAQGYTHFVYPKDGYQSLCELNDINDNDFKIGVALVCKEPIHPSSDIGNNIAELIAEDIECNWVDQTGDDTEEVYNIVKELDFSIVAKMIDEALLKVSYYHQETSIELIP